MEETYAGRLEGAPTLNDDRRQIETARRRMDKIWGERATYVDPHILPAVCEDGNLKSNTERAFRLPRYTYHAWLISRPMQEEYCDSELVVIWFGPTKPTIDLVKFVEQGCRGVPWETCARDFNY